MKPTGNAAIFEGSPYEQHTDARHQYGAKMFMENGDIYRYAKLAADVSAGNLLVGLSREDNHQNIALSAAASVGATSLAPTVGGTAVDANEYDQGWLIFNDVSPEGEIYGVTSHGASTGGSEAVTFYIEPTLKTAATTSSEVTLVRNTWNSPAVSQLIAEPAAGIVINDFDVSVAEFGWLKTRGIAPAYADNTGITVGYVACISNEDNGRVGVYSDVDAEVPVGQMMDAGTNDEFNPINLFID